MMAPPPPSAPSLYPEETAKLLLAALLSSSYLQSTDSPTSPDDGPPQLPMTITIDATTRIMGHCNTIQLPSAEKIAGLMTVAMKGTGVSGSDRKIEVKVAAGVEIRGSRNVVLSVGKRGEGGPKEDSDRTSSTERRDGDEAGRKRRADSEPVEMPSRKRVAIDGARV